MKITKNIFLMVVAAFYCGILPAEAAHPALKVQPVKANRAQKCVEYYTINGQFYCSNKAVATKPALKSALANEVNQFSFDGRAWKLDWWNQNPKQPMLEYVLTSETVDTWTEMVTSQFFPGLQSKLSPQQFMQLMMAEMVKRGFQPTVKIISQSPSSILFEWKLENQPTENQDELQSIIADPKGLHVIHYASRPTMASDRRTSWIKILSHATPKY